MLGDILLAGFLGFAVKLFVVLFIISLIFTGFSLFVPLIQILFGGLLKVFILGTFAVMGLICLSALVKGLKKAKSYNSKI